MAAGLLAAWLGGIAMRVFRPERWVEDYVWKIRMGDAAMAEAMLSKGVAVGTTLALMMSFAALSLPEMLILRKVFRWPALALFAGVLAVAFTLMDWGFNLIV